MVPLKSLIAITTHVPDCCDLKLTFLIFLILQLQGHSERIDVLTCRPGGVVQVLPIEGAGAADIASPPVRRDTRIVTRNDIVRAEFIFFACAGAAERTVKAG